MGACLLYGIKPSGTLSISSNGVYNVTKYAKAKVATTPKTQTVTISRSMGSTFSGTVSLTFSNLTTVYGITSISRSGSRATNIVELVCTKANETNALAISGNTVTVYCYNGIDVSQTVTITMTAVGI